MIAATLVGEPGWADLRARISTLTSGGSLTHRARSPPPAPVCSPRRSAPRPTPSQSTWPLSGARRRSCPSLTATRCRPSLYPRSPSGGWIWVLSGVLVTKQVSSGARSVSSGKCRRPSWPRSAAPPRPPLPRPRPP